MLYEVITIYVQILQGGQVGNPLRRVPRGINLHGGGIQRPGCVRPHQAVDHIRHPLGGGEVGTVQVEGDGIPLAESYNFV